MQLEIFKKAVELNMKDIFIMMRARSTISFAICFLINSISTSCGFVHDQPHGKWKIGQ